MEELLEILSELNPEIDFETEDALIDDELLTSFDILQIVAELSDHYDIEISAKDIVPENFQSAAAILELVESLKD